ncbi:hypothetical protein GQ43DRAFT_219664 [Delitschia confertaspora ATCC 74209]|uniref:DNA polymerase delta subunit 4 n=1 Tax=Delitschia confertaspora ATCC 74209 TaxID=1513339 RepID=A0A9P4MNJ5_9PLEO|nr:hypothetical protein GQ43DRAFT_219664 [Delitschia confertaspora ATCC 74209]
MPPKRRSSGVTPKATQSRLAFHGPANRVTKPGARAQLKKSILAEPTAQILEPETEDFTAPGSLEPEISTKDADILQQTKQEVATAKVVSAPEDKEARRISDAKIKKYWQAKEKERKFPRVHQQGLGLHEKILREWDTSGQYGPCIGIARLKRWKRANRLRLNPPIEVLAVLLREQDKNNSSIQKSRMDELLNSQPAEF